MAGISFSKKIAFRYLWARKGEAFISIMSLVSILGIAVGVAVLNIVMAVMTGFEHELKEKIVGADSHIVVRKLGEKIPDWRSVEKKLADLSQIHSISPYTHHQALIRYNDRASGLIVRGILPNTEAANQLESYINNQQLNNLFALNSVTVSTLEDSAQEVQLPGIVVGRELANQLGLFKGAIISLLSPSVNSTPFGLVPKFKRFIVVEIYSSGLIEYESGLAYIDLKEAQKFFNLGETISGFELRVKKVDQAPLVAENILNVLGGLNQGFVAQDWTQRNKALWDAIRLEKRVYFLVLLLIIVMASFSIVTTLVMIVLEKRKDVAVLRTLGATAKSISSIFFLQGAVIGSLGTILGLILGFCGATALKIWGFPIDERVFQMSTLPIRIIPENFLIVGFASFVIACLTTIYPAKRASKIHPVEALRSE